MPSKQPPQPPPANQRLYNQQTYDGFVLTIDGHLTYSPFTDVDTSNLIPGGGGVANWVINDQGFFYNTSRGITIDRTGSFVKIYDQATTQPIATAIILNANFAANTIQIKVILYEFGKDVFDLDPSLTALKLRLEDNWKFCSNIPDWIPAGAESLDRWIPIMSSEFEPTLGQKLDLKGGVTSVDGLSIPLVLDTNYQDNNRLQRLFAEKAVSFQYSIGELVDVDHVTETNLPADGTIVTVIDPSFVNPGLLPDDAAKYFDYPFLNPTGLELALPEPWFIDTEAIIATSRIAGIVPPGVPPSYIYPCRRGIDSTPQAAHGKYTVIFNGMPYPIGQTCKLWEVTNFNRQDLQDWFVTYRGMIENLVLSEGLATCTMEISALTFTARVNSNFIVQETAIERRKAPQRVRQPSYFFNTFIATQSSAQDLYGWVKIGEIAIPIVLVGVINYLAAKNDPAVQEDYFNKYGLLPDDISSRSAKTLSSGATDVGYKLGFEDSFGDIRYVSQLQAYDPVTYGIIYQTNINNYFNIEPSIPAGQPSILPDQSPWGYYILDQLPDQGEHNAWASLRVDNNLFRDTEREVNLPTSRREYLCDYISEKDPVFIHLFQNFSKGYSRSDLPEYARPFFYTGGDTSIVSVDKNSFYLHTSVIDVILQILTSTGSGTTDVDVPSVTYRQVPGVNGPWDLIPREFGLAINIEEINLDSFSKVRLKRQGMNNLMAANIYMEVGKDTPQKFLEEQILKPFFLALGTDSIGKIILVDVSDISVGTDAKTILPASFVRKNGRRTRVGLTYDATDLADSFTYMWKEPYRASWADPYFIRTVTSSGVATTSSTRELADGTVVTIKSKARLFPRIQASPIKYELRYAPVTGGYGGDYDAELDTENVGPQSIKYLRRFNRIVPRAKFELFWDYGTSPDLGDVVTFNLDAIPDKDGIIGNNNKIIVGKVIDIKVDRKAKTAEYTAILTDTSFAGVELVWNLTAELNGPAPSPNTWELTINEFCFGANPNRDSTGNIIWQFDASQFLIGSRIIVWDLNWRYVADALIVNVTEILPGVFEIEVDDDTGFVTGYRITLETIGNSTTPFAFFQTWFGEGQKYLV